MIGSAAWVFRINFSLGRGQLVPCKVKECVGAEGCWWFRVGVKFRKAIILLLALFLSLIEIFKTFFFFPSVFVGNEAVQDLSRLLSEMHVNIFTRGPRGAEPVQPSSSSLIASCSQTNTSTH